jgi:L-alanine-DL-glutamate epimerase-like enolase superfamily enzyme
MRPRLTAAFYGGRGFSLYHACGSASRVPLAPHFHDEYLICAQLRGDEHCHVAGKLHEFRSGDVALINPHQVHTGNTEGEDVEYISLYVDASCVQRIAAELGADARTPEFTVVRIANHAALVEEMARLLAAVQARGGTVFPTPHSDDDPELELPRRVGPPALAAALAAAAHEPGRPPDDDLSVDEALTRVVVHAFEEFSNLRTPLQRSTNRVSHRKIARALEPLDIMWLEEIMPPDNVDAFAQLRSQTTIPICQSERVFTRFGFRPWIDKAATDIVMMDLSWGGGLTEGRKVAAMADTAMLPFTCHDTIGPVALWAATHMLLNAPNGLIMEMVRGYVDGWYNDVVEDRIQLIDGRLVLPDRPGLGTRLRDDLFARPNARIETTTEESLKVW